MATGSQILEIARGKIEATEGAGGTPTRLLYLPHGSVSIEHPVTEVEDVRGWAKVEPLADLYPELEDLAFVVNNAQWGYAASPWWLCLFAASGSGAPTTVDTSAYQRDFLPSMTDNTVSATGVRSAHLQWSATDFAATRVWKMEGMVGEELTISMRKSATGTDSGITWSGRFRSAEGPTFGTSFDGSLTDTEHGPLALGQQFKTFVDDTYGGIGGTADTNIIEATFRYTNPPTFHDGADGTDNHTSMHRPGAVTSELSFVRKFSNTTEYDKYTGTAFVKGLRAVRCLYEGAVVGAATAKNTFRLDFVGKYGGPRTDPVRRNGMWYSDFRLRGTYDATLLAAWQIRTINAVPTAFTTT